MEKENLNGNTSRINTKQEEQMAVLPGTAHHCCGKCRQKNERKMKPCDNNHTDAAAPVINTTLDDQNIIQTTK